MGVVKMPHVSTFMVGTFVAVMMATMAVEESVPVSKHCWITAIDHILMKYDIIEVLVLLLTDVNECNEGTYECPRLTTCKNTIGSYECECADGSGDCRGT